MGWISKIKDMFETSEPKENGGFYPTVETEMESEEEEMTSITDTTAATPVSRTPMDIVGTDSTAAIELKVVRPESYAWAPKIADHLRNHCTVVLNLEAVNKEDAKRLIDFLAGVAYSLDGQLKNVSVNTYIITPCNVDIADSKGRVAELASQESAAVSLTSDTLF